MACALTNTYKDIEGQLPQQKRHRLTLGEAHGYKIDDTAEGPPSLIPFSTHKNVGSQGE
jgi:hypothetical protein